jgi:manganese/zinc/iron transport system permease protein
VAHAALPGICVAFFVVGDKSFAAFLVGALVFGVLAAASISFVRAHTRVKEDAAIAIAIGAYFGLGIVLQRLIQNMPEGNRAGLDSFIFGKAASMVRADTWRIAGVAAVVLAAVALLYKELKALCFDREFASAQGWPVLRLDLLLMALICVCTVAGLPAVGIVLMVALLVIPGVAARFWTDRLGPMLLIAGALGAIAATLGTALSATIPTPSTALTRGWPTGPMIVLVAAACFVVSLLAAPGRGLIAEAVRVWRLRRRIAFQNFLRSAYEAAEAAGGPGAIWRRDALSGARAVEAGVLDHRLYRARRRGHIEPVGDGYRLSAAGLAEAQRIVRAHRLWELFLIEEAAIAPDHVDRDADQIEHVLARELVERLEDQLRAQGRLPAPVPPSPHVIGGPPAGAPR